MNPYEQKQEARRQRLQDRAETLRRLSASLHAKAHGMASCIPFGQPILVGHHSEGRDRSYRAKIHGTFRRCFDAQDKAVELERRAASVGHSGISSDDPSAIEKLRAKLAGLQACQEIMKGANKIIRKNGTVESKIPALVALGLSEEQAARCFVPNCFNIIGFARFELTNNNARIKQVKQRIQRLEQEQARAAQVQAENGEAAREKTFDGFTYREDMEENRLMFIFPGKPDEKTRSVLKSAAFKWSPTRGAWVRQITPAARNQVKSVIEALAH